MILERVYAELRVHRTPALLVAGLLIALTGAFATRIHPREDASTLFSSDPNHPYRRAAEMLNRFGTLDTLLIDIEKPGASEAEIEAMAQTMAQKLEASGLFRRVLFELDQAGFERLFNRLFEHRFFLFPAPREVGPRVEMALRDLMSPAGPMMEGLTARDPLDQRNEVIRRLEAIAPTFRLDTGRGTLLSADHRHALVVAEPASRSLDVQATRKILDEVARLSPEGAQVELLGAHVFAYEAARSIRRDVWTTIGTSILAALLLFSVVFRLVRVVVAITLPVAMGGLLAGGVIGALGLSIHGITFGFAAVFIGVGLDYGAHLVVHFRARRAFAPDESSSESMTHTLGAVGRSLAIGALTSVAAFGTLLLSGTPALMELVLFAGLGITGSFVFAVLVLPLLPGLMWKTGSAPESSSAPGSRPIGPMQRHPRVVCAVAALVTVVLASSASRVQFDGDIRSLDYQPPEVRAVEARFAERYRNPRHPSLVIASGGTRELALERSDRALELLQSAREDGMIASFSSPSLVLPSARAQGASLEAYDRADLRARVSTSALQLGLDPAFFEPFFADLTRAQSGESRPLQAEDLADTPVASLLARSLVAVDGEHYALSVVHAASSSVSGSKRLPAALRDALVASGAEVVSAAEVAASAVEEIKRSVATLSLAALALVSVLLGLYYRRARPVIDALAPALVGLLWAFGFMGLAGVRLNIVSAGAFALVSGVAVDYGIFMTDAAMRKGEQDLPIALRSVALAALTTLIGFGSLLFAKSPVMWSLGFGVSAGVLASWFCASVLMPAVWTLFGAPGRDAGTCSRCGSELQPAPRRWIAAQIVVLATLALGLIWSWLVGGRQGGVVWLLLVFVLDLAYLAALVFRLARAPWTCRRCRG